MGGRWLVFWSLLRWARENISFLAVVGWEMNVFLVLLTLFLVFLFLSCFIVWFFLSFLLALVISSKCCISICRCVVFFSLSVFLCCVFILVACTCSIPPRTFFYTPLLPSIVPSILSFFFILSSHFFFFLFYFILGISCINCFQHVVEFWLFLIFFSWLWLFHFLDLFLRLFHNLPLSYISIDRVH